MKMTLERLTPSDDEATRLHLASDGACSWSHEVWLDTDVGAQDGLVVGVGETRDEAIDDAITELSGRIADLRAALRAGS